MTLNGTNGARVQAEDASNNAWFNINTPNTSSISLSNNRYGAITAMRMLNADGQTQIVLKVPDINASGTGKSVRHATIVAERFY